MTFYLILLVITVLGLLALVLIFWDKISVLIERYKNRQRKDYDSENIVEDTFDIGYQTDLQRTQPYHQENELADIAINPAHEFDKEPLVDNYHFSALDDLLPEADPTPLVTTDPQPKPVKKNAEQEFLVLYVLAKPGHSFVGYELLQSLTALNLRYGKMNIFHRHETADDTESTVFFSVASAVEPGIFDLDNIGALACPGLTFFMSNQVDTADAVFELMLETTRQLADDLDGIVCNSQREPLSEADIDRYQAKLIENK